MKIRIDFEDVDFYLTGLGILFWWDEYFKKYISNYYLRCVERLNKRS